MSSCFDKTIMNTLNIDSQFIWLLSNEDTDVCRSIAKYLNLCFLLRTKVCIFVILHVKIFSDLIGSIRMRPDPTINQTLHKHAKNYTTDVVVYINELHHYRLSSRTILAVVLLNLGSG